MPQEPAEPIATAHKERFEAIRDRVIAELNGEEVVGGVITEDEIFGRKEMADTTATTTTATTATK
jgi:hypothetical protein